MTRRCGSMLGGMAVAFGAVLLAVPAHAQVTDALNLAEIPMRVIDALRARFQQVEIHQWTREEEDGVVLYDIEFTREGRKFEADIKEDGTIHNWEQEIAADDLPASVKTTVEREYGGARLTEIMAITTVTKGTEILEGYEIVLVAADGKEMEVTIAPDGTILERPEARR